MKILIVFLIIISSNFAKADGLYTGAWSHHFTEKSWKRKFPINPNQNLLAYEYNSYIVGTYQNSLGDTSYLLNKYFDLYKTENFQYGLYAGAVYGYRFCMGKNNVSMQDKKTTCLDALPEIRYTKYKLQPAILLFSEGVAITFRWQID